MNPESLEIARNISSIVTPVILFFLTIICGIIAYFLKSVYTSLKEGVGEAKAGAEEAQKDLADFKLEATKDYISTERYVRGIAAFGYKVDKMVALFERLVRAAETSAKKKKKGEADA